MLEREVRGEAKAELFYFNLVLSFYDFTQPIVMWIVVLYCTHYRAF